ncbi:SIR2 family protein [Hoeflea poritis]|uniref:SIR2 family protein n=1 Tax=Hoeflea poritis TaxID=2993659 RepID=A0ABT4VJ77_9HYPH|nr:SIR2 family protein [Hoeflea poritis]MDA4844746.1 SIR2 family protein [Hoeflea poritis]
MDRTWRNAHELREYELQQWPYSVHSIDETLDVERIEGRAKQLLFQALNRRNLVAFVGSGVPIAYGRLSWSEWLAKQSKNIKKLSKAYKTCAKASELFIERHLNIIKLENSRDIFDKSELKIIENYINTRCWEINYFRKELNRISYTMDRMSGEEDPFLQTEMQVVFEVASKLQEMLLDASELFIEKGKDGNWKLAEGDWHLCGFNPRLPHARAPIDISRILDRVSENARTIVRGMSARRRKNYLRLKRKYKRALRDLVSAIDDPATSLSVEDFAKRLLVDECAHAEGILEVGLTRADGKHPPEIADFLQYIREYGAGNSGSNLRRNIRGIREDPSRFWSLAYFRTNYFLKRLQLNEKATLDEFFAGPWRTAIEIIGNSAKENKTKTAGGLERRFISPTHRFTLALILKLMSGTDKGEKFIKDEFSKSPLPDEQDEGAGLDEREDEHSIKQQEFESRRSLIDDELDPLAKCALTLGIRHYLTTNYDLEIERYFRDRGYQHFSDKKRDTSVEPQEIRRQNQKNYPTDQLGGFLKDDAFEPRQASELVAFSVDQDNADAAVFHLHGRATRDSNLVITERNYMDLYLRNDKNRDTVNESIRVAFSANPLLFIGLGMNEADLMRPFREFMSNRDRQLGRTAIALSPGMDSKEKRAQHASLRYVRYGAHTIFYGDAWVKDGEKYKKIDWLHRIMKLLKAISDVNKETKRRRLSSNEIFNRIDKSVGKCEIRNENGETSYQNALDLIFDGLDRKKKNAQYIVKNTKFTKCAFICEQLKSKKDVSNELFETHAERHRESIDFELEFIPELLRIAIRGTSGKSVEDKKRDIEAMKIAIDGVTSSILTASMCISLEELERERKDWWHLWQAGPPVRVPQFRMKEDHPRPILPTHSQRGDIHLPNRFIRHELDNTITRHKDQDGTVEPSERSAYSNLPVTGVLPFDTFINATWSRMRQDQDAVLSGKDRARRLHVIAAHRGSGKGIFQSTLSTNRGMQAYIEANWPGAVTGGNSPIYATASFINLSFSSEVASTFDMLEGSVWYAAMLAEKDAWAISGARPGQDLDEDITRRVKEKQVAQEGISRIRRLEAAFRLFAERAGKHRRNVRLLVCISATELLHYPGGLVKNREIEQVLNLLVGEKSRDWPIDVVLVTGERTVSETLAPSTPFLEKYRAAVNENSNEGPEQGHPLLFVPTMRPDINPRGLQNICRRMDRINLDFAGMMPEPQPESARGALEQQIPETKPGTSPQRPHHAGEIAYVHFMRTVKPERLLVDNFFPLAVVLFFGFVKENAVEEEPMIEDVLKKGIGAFRFDKTDREDVFKTPDPAESYRQLSSRKDDEIAEQFWKWQDDCKSDLGQDYTDLFAAGVQHDLKSARELLLKRYRVENKVSQKPSRALREWRDIRALLANNRYCLTILLACAQRIALSQDTLGEACEAAEAFIRNTVDHVKTVSAEKREEVVLSDVLDAYEAFDRVGHPSDDIRLHLCLLRHLGVMVGPCSADVLAQVPEIRHYFENIYVGNDRLRIERINEALTELAERGLVFRLRPHPRLINRYNMLKRRGKHRKKEQYYGPENNPETTYRYALHRLMQAHVTRKMGSGPRDAAHFNSYAPSLFASMPSDLPRLNHEAYTFLGSLLANLSQYPDHRAAMPGPENWHYAKTPLNTQIQALRAALGVVRSSFSIAVVSRFEDYSYLGEHDVSRRGYFEEYRVQVRWLIRKAYELLDRSSDKPLRDYDPYSTEFAHINAFYADEVVWLYNECGVVNLVQGNLSDAVSLLRQAITINRRIEGQMDGGAQHNRISLNLAIAQLERGRLTAARSRLTAICGSEEQKSQRKGRVWHIAHGYLGLVDHLMGNIDSARRHYERAIRVLDIYGDTRACAIFYRHAGDIERAQGDFDKAKSNFRSALAFAEAGGHEDVHKRVRLSMIRADIAASVADGRRPEVTQVMVELKMVGDYADIMEMPSLRVDVDHVRAELLLADGETTLAGELLSRNLTITKRNEMYLRMNGTLTRYAEALHLRGLSDQANSILFSSLEIAKRTSSQAEINAVESVFEKLNPTGAN